MAQQLRIKHNDSKWAPKYLDSYTFVFLAVLFTILDEELSPKNV